MIRFVNLMEGQIWLESEGLGKGCTATFIVKLGIADQSNESKLPFTSKIHENNINASFPGLKVLVMDENGLVTFYLFLLRNLCLDVICTMFVFIMFSAF